MRLQGMFGHYLLLGCGRRGYVPPSAQAAWLAADIMLQFFCILLLAQAVTRSQDQPLTVSAAGPCEALQQEPAVHVLLCRHPAISMCGNCVGKTPAASCHGAALLSLSRQVCHYSDHPRADVYVCS